MVAIFLILFSLSSFATDSICEDDIDRFLQVTKLESITCEEAYYELHERCEQKIPTAPMYKLEEFCCAFCANLPDSTTAATTTTAAATTAATTSLSDDSSSGYVSTSPTSSSDSGYVYEASYNPTYAPTAAGYSSSTSTSNDSDDNSLILGVTITTILAVLFLVGWVILYFQLDKRGYWTKGIIKAEPLGSDSEGEDTDSSSSESYSSNASLYGRGNSGHDHLLHRQHQAAQQHRAAHGPPPQMFHMPFQLVPPMQGFSHGMVPGPMGFIPPPMQPPQPSPGDHYSKPNHQPTASYSHGPFTNASVHDFDDDSNRYFSLANHLRLPSDSETTHTTFSGSTTTTRTDNHTTDSDAGKAETPHKRQESLDPMKLVVDMQRQLESHQSENTLNTILDSPHHETKSMGSTDSHVGKHEVMKKEDEIHIVIETTGRDDDEPVKRDVHVL